MADEGVLLYDPCFLPPDLAWSDFAELKETTIWEQKPGVFDYLQPRLTAAFGDDGLTNRYSRTTNTARPWIPKLLEIRRRIEAIAGEFNFCLLNRYRSGVDSVGWHADEEPGLDPVIGSLSLGATRRFRIWHNTTKETHSFAAGHGTLIIMAGSMQQLWMLEVPKTTENIGERINLTFRQIEPTGRN